MSKPIIIGTAVTLLTLISLSAFVISIALPLTLHNKTKYPEPEKPLVDQPEDLAVQHIFRTLDESNIPCLANKMASEIDFEFNLNLVRQYIQEHLSDKRITFIHSDGRIFFDSHYSDELHTGKHVFQNKALRNFTIEEEGEDESGNPITIEYSELAQMAIENHASRPEIFNAFRSAGIWKSSRPSSTVHKKSNYYAKGYVNGLEYSNIVIRVSDGGFLESDECDNSTVHGENSVNRLIKGRYPHQVLVKN